MSSEFDQFDEQLRRVATPPGLAARLRAIPDWNDDELDRELAEVGLPDGLLGRLHDIVDDEVLDHAIRQVPVSAVSLARARGVAAERDWAVAASLILLVWGGYLAGGLALLSHSRPVPSAAEVVWLDLSPVEISARQATGEEAVPETPVVLIEPWIQSPPAYEPEASEPDAPLFVSVGTGSPLAELQALMTDAPDVFWQQQFDSSWQWLRDRSPPPAEAAAGSR